MTVPVFRAVAEPSWAGSESCAGCHQAEYAAWRTSHHYRAMQPASADTVLGNFDDARFEYGGVTSRFFRRDDTYWVETDGPDGALREFEIAYTFGFEPLQQYLVPFPNGRYQALNIVWDSRSGADGGQRWVHLYPMHDRDGQHEPVDYADRVHWTGSFQNWNARCAVCHSTGLEKNYSASADRYGTTWQEINVACEACHGPASAHVAWARGDPSEKAGQPASAEIKASAATSGFAVSLADRDSFGPPAEADRPTLERQDDARPVTQLETCAACHARRSEIAAGRPGDRFGDRYRLALIEPGLYFPDGQVRDEVYVYGSFLQSKMHAAGVVCTNCHDAHSNALLADGNAVCTQCHSAEAFDRSAHHHHPAGSPGAACVDCHMPARTYMVVDDRRDHSFRVPEPRLSRELGVPNACSACHSDRDAAWAETALAAWGVSNDVRATHAPLLDAAWAGRPDVLPDLLQLAVDSSRPAILRASAVLASGALPSRGTLEAVTQLLWDDDALVREATVRSVDWLQLRQRYPLLKHLVADPRKSVRMAVARQLAGVPADALPADEGQALTALKSEYLASLRYNADMPEEQMNLGLYYTENGEAAAAERAYRKALALSPAFIPALLNLADLYRASGLDAQARPLLEQAVERAPEEAAGWYALGLLEVRSHHLDQALPHLRKAADLDPQNPRYPYVLAVALWDGDQRGQAIATLESALETHPGNPDIEAALASYRQQLTK